MQHQRGAVPPGIRSVSHGIYVTGTDTGAGKTLASTVLVRALHRRGLRVAAMKPVASGSRRTAEGWRNEDAEALLAACGGTLAYADVNPYALEDATAPEIAAARQDVSIDVALLESVYRRLAGAHDVVVVEGVGGWEAPLATHLLQADLCRRLGLPAVLVVGMRLGCMNHARLTARAMATDGIRCLGWIANAIDPDLAFADETRALLERDLGFPLLGALPYAPHADPDALAGHIDVTGLLA